MCELQGSCQSRKIDLTNFTVYADNNFQALLVTGGLNVSSEYYDSTEIYKDGLWTEAAKLPLAVTGLKGITLDNSVFMTG